MAIELTQAAADHVAGMMDGPDSIIRLGVSAGGCSGYEYVMIVEPTARTNDRIFSSHGVRVAVDPRSYLYVNGTIVDFDDSLMGGGFQFSNPNAKRSCGCGTSFQV